MTSHQFALPRRPVTKRILFFSALLSFLLIVGACKDSKDAGTTATDAEAGSAEQTAATGDATTDDSDDDASSSDDGSGATTDVVTSAATTTAETAEAVSPPQTRYVGHTSGVGVSLRDGYTAGARIDGAWPEGRQGEVILRGLGECEGWSVLSSGGTTSWVSNAFLSPNKPRSTNQVVSSKPAPIPTIAPTSTATPTATATAAPPVIADGEFVVENVVISYPTKVPQIQVTVRNISDAVIISWQINVCAFDQFGNPLLKNGFQPHCQALLSVVALGPDNVGIATWPFLGMEGVATATATATSSQMQNGDSWSR